MESTYHVRIRGRVHGPFDLTKLRALVRKGQLGRMHEVSPDGQTWASASTVPEIFQGQASVETQTTPSVSAAASHATAPAEAVGPSNDGEWYYSVGEGSEGPFTYSQIKRFVREGKLSSYDNVWHPDEQEWVEVQSIPGMPSVAEGAKAGAGSSSEVASFDLTRLGDAFGAATGWKLLITGWLLLVGVLTLIAGLVSLLLSNAVALPSLIQGGILTYLGSLAHASYSNAKAAANNPSHETIRAAIQAENRLWQAVGILLLLAIVLGLIGFVVLATLTSSLSNLS